jgi:Flp pilus assembly protein TadD
MAGRRLNIGLFALLALGAALGACATSGGASRAETPADVARMKMAGELVSRGDWAEAFGLLNELHQQRPQDPQVLIWRGIVYRERGLLPDAETDLREALKLAPESPDAHAALGILFDIQMRPGAEAEHREAVRLAPNNPAYLNNLGFSLFLREHFKEAIAEYEKAARLAPLSPRVRTNMGFAYAALGDLPRAAREFHMGGSEADAANNLGFAYERRGDMANAYDLYLQSVRIDPTAGRARSNLVHAAIVLGRPVPPDAVVPAPASSSVSPPVSSSVSPPISSFPSPSASPSSSPSISSSASLASPPDLAKQPIATP